MNSSPFINIGSLIGVERFEPPTLCTQLVGRKSSDRLPLFAHHFNAITKL